MRFFKNLVVLAVALLVAGLASFAGTQNSASAESIETSFSEILVLNVPAGLSGSLNFRTGQFSITNHRQVSAYVGAASYHETTGQIDDQEFIEGYQADLVPGETWEGRMATSCWGQLDIFEGEILTSLDGQRYGARLIRGVRYGSPEDCLPPAVGSVSVDKTDEAGQPWPGGVTVELLRLDNVVESGVTPVTFGELEVGVPHTVREIVPLGSTPVGPKEFTFTPTAEHLEFNFTFVNRLAVCDTLNIAFDINNQELMFTVVGTPGASYVLLMDGTIQDSGTLDSAGQATYTAFWPTTESNWTVTLNGEPTDCVQSVPEFRAPPPDDLPVCVSLSVDPSQGTAPLTVNAEITHENANEARISWDEETQVLPPGVFEAEHTFQSTGNFNIVAYVRKFGGQWVTAPACEAKVSVEREKTPPPQNEEFRRHSTSPEQACGNDDACKLNRYLQESEAVLPSSALGVIPTENFNSNPNFLPMSVPMATITETQVLTPAIDVYVEGKIGAYQFSRGYVEVYRFDSDVSGPVLVDTFDTPFYFNGRDFSADGSYHGAYYVKSYGVVDNGDVVFYSHNGIRVINPERWEYLPYRWVEDDEAIMNMLRVNAVRHNGGIKVDSTYVNRGETVVADQNGKMLRADTSTFSDVKVPFETFRYDTRGGIGTVGMPFSAFEPGHMQLTSSWVQWTDYAQRYPLREYRDEWSDLPDWHGEYKYFAELVADPLVLLGAVNPHNRLAQQLAEKGLIAPAAWPNAIQNTESLPANIVPNPMALLVPGLEVNQTTISFYDGEYVFANLGQAWFEVDGKLTLTPQEAEELIRLLPVPGEDGPVDGDAKVTSGDLRPYLAKIVELAKAKGLADSFVLDAPGMDSGQADSAFTIFDLK